MALTTWVFVEEEAGGTPAPLALEMLTKARSFDGKLAAAYLGPGSEAAFTGLGRHGAQTIYHLSPAENDLPTAAAAAALQRLVADHQPDLLLFGLTYTDRDVAGRLSARLDRPVISNAVDVMADEKGVRVTNEILGGVQLVETAFRSETPWLVIVRPKSFAAEPAGDATPEVVPASLPDVGHAGAAVVTDRYEESSEGPQLGDADIIVSGGRGLGTPENFAMLEEVAGLLRGAVGATRAVVDAGWVPYAMQVGQTGKTVKPKVYLACGISGAMQHLVGMKDAGTIIAINKDAEAPIFGISDLGVVGDVHKVVPKLIEALRSRG
ncbi:MAG: electron transfer flavoprotein subunit alpha/FixB family protein [Acidimicrobiia bacterium]